MEQGEIEKRIDTQQKQKEYMHFRQIPKGTKTEYIRKDERKISTN